MKVIKLLSVLLVLAMLFSIAACTTPGDEIESSDESTSESQEGNQPGESESSDSEETSNTESDNDTAESEDYEESSSEESSSEEESEAPEYPVISIAEALEICAGLPSEQPTTDRYYIRGTIVSVTNAEYGGMTITDGNNEISVYGTYGSDGVLRYSELEEKPYKGDEVLLYCTLQNYNGNYEIKSAWLISFKSNQGNFDLSEYKTATIAEARAAKTGDKLRVSGIVARITFANGMKPNGFILVNGADSIYVYDGDAAARVSIGNTVEIAASKTYWILDTEQTHAATYGYKGCNQLESVNIISNDNGNSDWISASFPTATVKELMDNPITNDITTQIYKTTALIKKTPGQGFTNYYIDDLDEKTGSYVYTQCNGSDFAWLDEFDGKLCTVYFVVLNAKSSVSGCVYRLLPIKVINENFVFNTDGAAEFAVKYHGATQFATLYTGNPALELTESVSSALLGFENATLSYSSSDENIIKIETVDGKTVMNCLESGKATVTVTGSYNGKTYSQNVEITVSVAGDIASVTVGEAISAEIGEEVTVKGIVGPSLVNQTGFYLIDETGVIAVCMTEDELAKVQLGNEIILKGTRAIRLKNGATVFGQANLDACEIIANNYGSHDYSTATFIEGKTAADFYALNANEDHGTEVYVLTVTVVVNETNNYSNIKLRSGDTEISLYCSSANQYKFLKEYNGQEVIVEIAPCNWNAKGYYAGCVLAIRHDDGTKTCNELNFSK